MPHDLTRSHFSLTLMRNIVTGQVIDEEGMLLVRVMEAGEEKVKKCTGANNERPVGWSLSDNQTIATQPFVLQLTVPAAPGPYVLNTFPLLVGALGASSVRVYDETSAAARTEVAPAPGANQFSVDYTTGILTFNANLAGHVVTIYGRYNLSVAQAEQLYYQRNVNNKAGVIFQFVAVGMGDGEIWTTEYDTAVDWSNVAVDGIYTMAGGRVSTVNTGTVLKGAVVTHVPDVNSPYLGLRFNMNAV